MTLGERSRDDLLLNVKTMLLVICNWNKREAIQYWKAINQAYFERHNHFQIMQKSKFRLKRANEMQLQRMIETLRPLFYEKGYCIYHLTQYLKLTLLSRSSHYQGLVGIATGFNISTNVDYFTLKLKIQRRQHYLKYGSSIDDHKISESDTYGT